MGYAQQTTNANDTSLGDIARALKAKKAKEPKPVKVFTNDNLTAPKDTGTGSSASPAEKSSAAPSQAPAAPATAHDAKYFRTQQSALQDQLDTHKRQLDVLQQKLGQNQMQFYTDPNQSLQQQYSREDVNKLTTDIDAKKKQIADDEKAIDDLRDQLRHEGGDPSWLR
jgi:predicted RNase H-like nuclease (RuvC/YqgF family)